MGGPLAGAPCLFHRSALCSICQQIPQELTDEKSHTSMSGSAENHNIVYRSRPTSGHYIRVPQHLYFSSQALIAACWSAAETACGNVTHRDLGIRQLVGFVFAGVLKVSKRYKRVTHHGNAVTLSIITRSWGRCRRHLRRRACSIELESDLLRGRLTSAPRRSRPTRRGNIDRGASSWGSSS